jgi:hypothetical protein
MHLIYIDDSFEKPTQTYAAKRPLWAAFPSRRPEPTLEPIVERTVRL